MNVRIGSLLAVLVVMVSFGAAPALASPIALYQFDDAGNLGLDSSGNSNTLISFGTGVSYTAGGESGGGLSLTGFGGLTTGSGNVPLGFPVGNGAYTISADFKSSFSGEFGVIGWGNYGSSNQVNAIRTTLSGGVNNYWWFNDLQAGSGNLDGNWHNVTFTYDGLLRSLYLDGSFVTSDFPGTANVGSGNFAIGRACSFCGNLFNNSSQFFVGALDDVVIYDQALSASAVALVAADDFGLPTPEPGTLLLLGPGLLATLLLRHRSLSGRRRASQSSD